MKNSRRYLITLLVITLALAALMAAFMYVLDPFNYFRWSEPRFFISGMGFNPGIVRNYDSDCYLIGSSMIQNTDMNHFRAAGYSNPVKLTKPGMTLNETLMMLRLVSAEGQQRDAYINLDVHNIVTTEVVGPTSTVLDEYLYNDRALDDWMYLFSFESWYRYGPVTFGMILLDRIGNLPLMLDSVTNIDNMARWYEDYIGQYDFEVQVANYKSNIGGTSIVEPYKLEIQLDKVDIFVDYFASYTQDWPSVTVGFAPYSALYWYVQDQQGIMDSQLEIKSYLIQRLLELDNVKIVDIQTSDEIVDLNHYRDQTHFDLVLQDMYTEAMLADEGNIRSIEDIEASNQRLHEIVDEFAVANSDWL